jgi:HEAT repeat protein
MTDKIIQFDVHERLLARVRSYIYGVEKLIDEGDEAIDVLLRAYPLAKDNLKIKIVLLLGTLASPAVVDPLLTIMRGDADSDAIRQAAAIQLSVVGAVLKDSEPLVHQLLELLQGGTPFDRANAAFALGWQGNLQAAPSLIDCLFNAETEVQHAAVNALSNIQDDRLFYVLTERLPKSSKEQQRSILFNLGRFSSRHNDIIRICKDYLSHRDSELRYDALVVLNTVADPNESVSLLEKCLTDPDARIRERALTALSAADHGRLTALEPEVRKLLNDSSSAVRRAAVRLFHRIFPTTVVQS